MNTISVNNAAARIIATIGAIADFNVSGGSSVRQIKTLSTMNMIKNIVKYMISLLCLLRLNVAKYTL